jgi:preprotein translocase subunit SecB
MMYLGIKVVGRPIEDGREKAAVGFNFEGVVMNEQAGIAAIGDAEDPKLFGVNLRIGISNEKGKIAPYDIDVEAVGSFGISPLIPKEKREELVLVNGCAILYSAIRDQVMTLTARSYHGTLILPTVNFLDKVKRTETPDTNKNPDAEITAPRPKRKKKA